MGFFLDQKIAGFASSYKNQVRLDPVGAGGACDLLILIVTTQSVGTINVGAGFGEVYIGAG